MRVGVGVTEAEREVVGVLHDSVPLPDGVGPVTLWLKVSVTEVVGAVVGVGDGLRDDDAEPKGVLVSPLGDTVSDPELVRLNESDWVAVGTQLGLRVKLELTDAVSLWELEGTVGTKDCVAVQLAVDVRVCGEGVLVTVTDTVQVGVVVPVLLKILDLV